MTINVEYLPDFIFFGFGLGVGFMLAQFVVGTVVKTITTLWKEVKRS